MLHGQSSGKSLHTETAFHFGHEKIQCSFLSVVIPKFKIWGLHDLIPNSESTSLYQALFVHQTAYSEDAALIIGGNLTKEDTLVMI